jgi:multidrug efflux pump subunit AcrA (membrane-fusion protein)
MHGGTTAPPLTRSVSRRTAVIGAAMTIVVLGLVLFAGFLPHHAQTQALARRARAAAVADSIPEVSVIRVVRAAPASELALPSTLQGLHEAAIYARSSGYVRKWYADIGTRVVAGQLLAEIDAPDLDQQLRQARESAHQAQASLALARLDLARWRSLLRDSVVTAEEFDQRQSTYEADSAMVAGAEANAERLATLQRYERVTAPFAGVITARNVDDGVLVSPAGGASTGLLSGTGGGAGAGGGTSGAGSTGGDLFRIARIDTVRAYVSVPQTYAPEMRRGLAADLLVRELPGRHLHGRVTRTADALDITTRTLLIEVDIANPDRTLLPGMYAEVQFKFARLTPPLLLSANALVFRDGGPQAAVVGPDSIVHLKAITITRDYGPSLEIGDGLRDGDVVVVDPPEFLRDGQRIRLRGRASANND